jgi:effector-binding domain-containing protein
MPINFGSVIKKLMKKIKAAEAETPDYMGLSDHTSKWNMNIYVAVDKEIPNTENVTLSGKFLSKVYEGNFKETEKWCKDFLEYAKKKNLKTGKRYMWYTTCPKCAKKYGKNYVVIISKLE